MPIGLRAAVRLLAVLPLRYDEREAALPAARMLPWFPVAGAIVGGIACCALLLPLPPLPRAAIALAVWTAVTGGFHEDGFLDIADAAFAPVSVERRREILKDPHVGAHAATAGGILLVLRFAALTAVAPVAVVAAAVAGRWAMTLTLATLRPARASGLGAAFADGARWWPPSFGALALLAACAVVGGVLPVTAAALACAVAATASAAFFARRLGGANGDVHGAAGLLGETAALYGFLVVQ